MDYHLKFYGRIEWPCRRHGQLGSYGMAALVNGDYSFAMFNLSIAAATCMKS
jgi:hypothetical protein